MAASLDQAWRRVGDIAVAVSGAGPTLLFFHGVGGFHGNWAAQLRHFAPRFRAAAWDARGYGRSGGGLQRFETLADDAAAVVRALGAPAHVVGLSMGGRIALDLWRRFPGLIASLTLADTSAGAPPDPARAERALALRLRPLEAGLSPADIADAIVDEVAGPDITPEARELLLDSHRRLHAGGYAAALRAVVGFADFPPWGSIDVPVLVMVGEHDRVATPARARAMAAAIPGARFALVPGAGHISNVEAPDAFNAALDAFLTEVA